MRQSLRRTEDCRAINNAVLASAAQKHSGVMKVERPPVTPATRCARAPLRARAVSPAGITTQSWSSGFRAQLWPGAGMALPCEAGPAGLTLRQTDAQGVSQPTHSQEEAATCIEAKD